MTEVHNCKKCGSKSHTTDEHDKPVREKSFDNTTAG